jgi:hypothetical protein
MEKRIEATVIDAIDVQAGVEGGRVRLRAKPVPQAGVIDGFLQLFSDRDFDLITSGTLSRKGFGTDYVDVAFDKDSASVSATDYTVVVPAAAFERLVARISRAVLEAAKAPGAQIARESWWSKAVEDATALIKKAYPKG